MARKKTVPDEAVTHAPPAPSTAPVESMTRSMQADTPNTGPIIGEAENFKPATYRLPSGNIRSDR